MATLREVEERDSKGNTIRVNPSVTFKADQNERIISGRHDFRLVPNEMYHEPITAQVQNQKIVFFTGTPDTTNSRRAAKEIKQSEVPAYILEMLRKNPIRVREARPTVYEVKIATVGDVEVTQTEELTPDASGNVNIEPVAPKLTRAPKPQPYHVEADTSA